MKTQQPRPPFSRSRARSAIAFVCACVAALATSALAPGQDLQSELDTKEAQLSQSRAQEGVLSTTINRYSNQIDQLAGEVAVLRNREAIVQQRLDETIARLHREKHRLDVLRQRFQRSLRVLKRRIVAIYKSDQPDMLTVILESNGFDDVLDRYEYLAAIQNQDSAIVTRVRDLREETRVTVDHVKSARDEIAARKAELERTRSQLEAREAALASVRDKKQSALEQVQGNIQRLEGDISGLEEQIQSQLQASSSPSVPSLPAGPIRGGSSGMIWPVNGPVVSGFGMRWGRMHEGIDIAVPSGTPIRAAKAGSVAFSGWYGGYGNYTCVNHGGGLSTCYAHQSSFAAQSGSVGQGQVIGYVGCTGHCFGDHLHFEVRVNGAAVDPLGYL
jgi:murein DD-endopeptidase MepM/ murein hydrolase activator NlpD